MCKHKQFVMRLDDACEKMDIDAWQRMEDLLDTYAVKPLVGIIPHCEDPQMDKYPVDVHFWDKVNGWLSKGWAIALHGYNHVYNTSSGGLNPVNKRSEFAGNTYEVQAEKIREGIKILRSHGIEPKVFFAPSHTFDEITLKALENESEIRIISDTWAWQPYCKYGFTFVPQQSGMARNVPFSVTTFCYHPNTMKEKDFIELEVFFRKYSEKFIQFPNQQVERSMSMMDTMLQKVYYFSRK